MHYLVLSQEHREVGQESNFEVVWSMREGDKYVTV